jgi:O-antigen/teichoic acid export membrane protein
MSNKKDVSSVEKNFFQTDHLKAGLKERAVRGGGITVFTRITDYVLQLVGTVILARLLSPEDFGLFGMVVAISGFFYLFKDLGLSDATVQSDSINHSQVSTLFWLNIAFSVIIMVMLWVLSPAISWFYKEPRIFLISIVSAFSFILAGMSTQHIALLRRGMFFYRIAAIEIIGTILSTILAIIMAIKGAGYWALVVKPLIQSFVSSAGAWIACPWRPGNFYKKSGIKPMVKFGANTMGYYFVNYFARNLDKTLIGWQNGASALGFYSRAYFLFIAPINQFSLPLQSVAVTTLTKLKSEPQKYRRYFLNALSLLAFVGMPVSTAMAALSDSLIMLLLGEKWMRTAQIFSILGLSAGIQVIYATQGWVYVSLGRADRWFRWGIIGSLVMVVSFIAGLPFGPEGVAFGYSASLYLLVIPALWFAGKPVGLTFWNITGAIWKYYVSSVIAGMGCWYFVHHFTSHSLYMQLIIGSLFFCALYLLSIVSLYRSFDPVRLFIQIVSNLAPVRKKKAEVV